jgi:hypothetical protein
MTIAMTLIAINRIKVILVVMMMKIHICDVNGDDL